MDIVDRLRIRAGNERRNYYNAADVELDIAAADEIERLREVVRQRTKLLDDQLGTPCEQIRHEQEIERLKDELNKAHRLYDHPRREI